MGSSGSKVSYKRNSNDEFFYFLQDWEISKIKRLKKKDDESYKEVDQYHILYRKYEVDLSQSEPTFKSYAVIYVPNNFNEETLNFQEAANWDNYSIALLKEKKYIKYVKKNNKENDILKYECKQYSDEDDSFRTTDLDLKVTKQDKEKNLIIIEICYYMKIIQCFGFYEIFIADSTDTSSSNCFLYIINDDMYFDEKELKNYDNFLEINNEFYFMNYSDMDIKIKIKGAQLNIENELDKNLLSKFSNDEIKQIKNSLNRMDFKMGTKELIHHKIIHNIKDKQDFIKMYYLFFNPHIIGKKNIGFSAGEEGEEAGEGGDEYDNEIKYPIIINEIKINDKLVKKYENYDEMRESENFYEKDDENNTERIYGYFISNLKELQLDYRYYGCFMLLELDCENTEYFGYFKLNYNLWLNI